MEITDKWRTDEILISSSRVTARDGSVGRLSARVSLRDGSISESVPPMSLANVAPQEWSPLEDFSLIFVPSFTPDTSVNDSMESQCWETNTGRDSFCLLEGFDLKESQ